MLAWSVKTWSRLLGMKDSGCNSHNAHASHASGSPPRAAVVHRHAPREAERSRPVELSVQHGSYVISWLPHTG